MKAWVIAVCSIGACFVTVDPLFGFCPVEVVVGVFGYPSIAIDTVGKVVEQVITRDAISLEGVALLDLWGEMGLRRSPYR